ncbi:hypothetical protein AB9D59_17920 [Blautia producta]|uniref:PD-(D/E)XK endonuclease-like domain-containing protein n=1 Tax=Blautia producta TaxID=33035 RepID=A0A4P6M0U9_9FIRM|nr:hypothetical protein [Blautia producta]QBE98086.1 hypothetical protein PMF13cell1_03650 [Blautia producta]
MPLSIYTYSNPYEINKELYWDSIKNCPHFCVSQTMANGMIGTYEEMTAGKVSTVENLVKGLFAYWESSECKIKQYTVIDEAINRLIITENSEKIKQSLRFNRKQLSNSLRILFELDMSIEEMRTELMTEEQRHLVELYRIIRKSDLVQDFTLKRHFTEVEIENAIRDGMKLERENVDISAVDVDTIVIHGVHQFSPMILQTIELVAKYKRVILLFNYQQQYKNVYQTWIDVYSSFDLPIKSQFTNEFKPTPLLANSYEGNLLADRMANLVEGHPEKNEEECPFEVMEFDNNTEFASYVAGVFEDALKRQEKDKDPRRSTLYYMQEQFYAANNSVNNILKIYYPGQFGERHFLTYPIGHFFLSITNMWNAEEGGIQIENMNDIVECLNSGFIREETPGKLYSIFNRTKEFFVRAETIDQIIELLGKLKKRIGKAEKDAIEKCIGSRLVYFDVTQEEIDTLVAALEQLNQITKLFYADFEDTENNFKKFYRRIKEFLETRILEAEDLEDEFRDVVKRVLIRLEEVDKIDATGSFDVLKETMAYYLKQEAKKGISANWIVRDFEQIDGDILKSRKQNKDIVYHFACLSDNDMNVTRRDRFPWPLDVTFFEVAQDPIDWKYQVYVKSRREYKNFKRYALIYGLQFNRVKFKLSYVKNIDDKENEMFYLLKILEAQNAYPEAKPEGALPEAVRQLHLKINTENNYGQYDFYRYRICKYRFLLESTIEKRAVFRDHFLLLKYLEILLENEARVALQGQIATEDVLLDSLNYEYRKLERKFEFVKDMHTERMDIITNAKNYLQKSVLKTSTTFPMVSPTDDIYMKKREEFIYLQLGNGDVNFPGYFKDVPQGEIDTRLNSNRVDAVGYAKSCGEWCQYCAVREICLEPYKYGRN